MNSLADLLVPALNSVRVPDLWQQQAVAALRAGKDVVVQAPTGAGKTLIFELWSNQGKNRGQAIYTVPTRALANDKLAEWRARGWEVGIATGDLSENLAAPVLVATLETQKHRLVSGEGPELLVIDEYQMLGDSDRGLNYELAIAMAPARTQLLLLSGSVANPQDVVKWLRRLRRDAILIRHDQRPVPLDEVHPGFLRNHLPGEIRGYWPRLVAQSLAEDLGPILIFAPRRQAAESMAAELARQLPPAPPLELSDAQKSLAGELLAKLLKARVAFHHSGLSYGARAGVIEPLAKAGQLRVVVATMGLAAGINFSLRSVALAGESYRRDQLEQPLKPDEILQMFGRAGRRGLDETGYVLVSANQIRLLDARPCQLARSGSVDWSALLAVMRAAAARGESPFQAAARVQERLYSSRPIALGVEEAMRHPHTPCRLTTDAERARHVRKRVRQFLNSQGEWQPISPFHEKPLKEIFVCDNPDAALAGAPPRLRSVLSRPPALEKIGVGPLIVIETAEGAPRYGRAVTVADRLNGGQILLSKWIRRLTQWKTRQAPFALWETKIAAMAEAKLKEQGWPVARFRTTPEKIVAEVSLAEQRLRAWVDARGVALWRPPEREVLPPDCAGCSLLEVCRQLSPSAGMALLWRRFGLIDAQGRPTRRGELTSFFTGSDGLAIAAALEEESYPVAELICDLANLDAGFRFCGDENRWGGRLAMACQRVFGLQTIAGYLENGLPSKYGAGAETVVAAIHKNPASKSAWITDLVGVGDIDRIIIEWRSLLRRIAHAPDLEWPRWMELKRHAAAMLDETQSPTLIDLPALEYHQTKRVDHRLSWRHS